MTGISESHFVPYAAHHQAGKGPALVFAPHPDDEIIGCGGAILRHLENRDEVAVTIMTDGRLGDPKLAAQIYRGWAKAQAVTEYIGIRQEESRAAAKTLGYGQPEFWDARDRELQPDASTIKRVVQKIEQVRPACVYAPSVHEMHPDHRALARILLAAVPATQIRPELLMYEIGRPIPGPDILVDITQQWERIEKAVQCFASQLKICPLDDYAGALNRFRTFTLPPRVTMAEAYLVIPAGSPDKAYEGYLAYMALEEEKKLYIFPEQT